MEKSVLLDVAISPLTLLERSRGRKRQGLILLYIIILTLVGVLGWRELSLWRLPSLKEPFDEAKLGVVAVPDDDNAMTWYRAAALRLKRLDNKVSNTLPKDAFTVGWSKADPALVRWVEENRDVFDFWLRGADRTDSLVVQPKDMTIATNLELVQTLRISDAWPCWKAPGSNRPATWRGPGEFIEAPSGPAAMPGCTVPASSA